MAVNTITTKLSGNLSGQTRTGALTPVPLATTLIDQDAHVQMTVTVEPTDILKLVCLPEDQGPLNTQQTLFLVQSDVAVQLRLNGVVELTFNLEPTAPLVIGGQPEVDQIEFTGIGATTAAVHITKIIGDATVPAISIGPGGGSNIPNILQEELVVAADGQTAFTLAGTPTGPVTIVVNGASYSELGGHFSVVGQNITWVNTPAPFFQLLTTYFVYAWYPGTP